MHCRYDVCTCIVCRYDRLCSVLLYVAYVSFDVHGVCDVRCMMYIHMWYTTYSDTGSLPTAHMGLFSLSVANHQFYSYNCAPTGMRIYSFLSTCMHAAIPFTYAYMHCDCLRTYIITPVCHSIYACFDGRHTRRLYRLSLLLDPSVQCCSTQNRCSWKTDHLKETLCLHELRFLGSQMTTAFSDYIRNG